MSRRICLALATLFTLAGCNLANCQDAPSAADSTNSSASATDDVTALKAENAVLKKEVSVQANTIAQLQAALDKAGIHHHAVTDTAPVASDETAPVGPASTNAAPTGPLKALPLDATNANAAATEPGAPAAESGPSRTYTVVKGDSLWKIAHKMYPGDTKSGVDKIQEANKDAIGNKPLKIGQVLIIPQ